MRCATSASNRRRRIGLAGFAAAAGLCAPAAARAAEGVPASLTASLGASIWDGDYGAPTDTHIWSAIAGVRYSSGGLRLSAIIPRMRIESDGTFFTGLGGTPLFVAPRIASLKHVRQGFGDLTLGASYLVPGSSLSGIDLDLSGRIKIPTASDASQLSTGKVDYSAGVEASTAIGRFTPAVSATYRVFGDNAQWAFRNGFDITAGGSYLLGASGAALVLNYEYVRAATRLIGDSHEIVGGVSTPLGRSGLRLSAFASKGLSTGASDVSGGASLAFTF